MCHRRLTNYVPQDKSNSSPDPAEPWTRNDFNISNWLNKSGRIIIFHETCKLYKFKFWVSISFIGTQPCPFIYVWSMICFWAIIAEVSNYDRDCANVKRLKYLLSGPYENVRQPLCNIQWWKKKKKYGSAACIPFSPKNKVNLYRLPFIPWYF